ncbi:MAG: hypothetical protein ACO1RT_05265 [Planctomycetaceae bacterium]
MRALIIVVVLVLAALLAGWIRFSRSGDSATIQIDGAEVRSDTQQIMQEGRELIDQNPVTVTTDESSDEVAVPSRSE